MKHKGFTVVEIIVVIVAIAILATITIVSYAFMTEDATDLKIRATTKSVGEALSLHESRTGTRLGVTGLFGNTGGVDAVLIPAGYLKTGYRDGITSTNATNVNTVFRWYGCADGSGGIVVYAALSNPTADDIANFTKVRTACGNTTSQAPDTGNPQYNYAQLF